MAAVGRSAANWNPTCFSLGLEVPMRGLCFLRVPLWSWLQRETTSHNPNASRWDVREAIMLVAGGRSAKREN